VIVSLDFVCCFGRFNIKSRYSIYKEVKEIMFEKFRDKVALSGITVLCIGVALLIFTFFSAYGFLTADLSPISTQDLMQTFGDALGPLIGAAIHLMYLGIMGWISSLITIRGVTLMIKTPRAEMTATQKSDIPQKVKSKPKIAKEPAKKPLEPEMIVIPLEEMETQPPTRQKSKSSM
jgi:hypothetical protein